MTSIITLSHYRKTRALILGVCVLVVILALFALTHVNANQPLYSCTQAFAEGLHDIPKSNPLYNPKLDRDHDGIMCEE